MRYRHGYWVFFICFIVTGLLEMHSQSLLRDSREGYHIIFNEMLRQDSLIEYQQDTIKYLKFKLTTLKSS